jgi:hypothetical protein
MQAAEAAAAATYSVAGVCIKLYMFLCGEVLVVSVLVLCSKQFTR